MGGFFLSLDGVDGCGKSTQIGLLKDWLESQGRVVTVVREPGGTKLGETLREILLHRTEIPLVNTAEMLLYMASRAQLVQEKILPALHDGGIVISDRFLLANVVYQSCAGVPADLIWQVGKIATGGRLPDLTILLDIDPKISFSRLKGDPDRLESRGLEYMNRVRQVFLSEAAKLNGSVLTLDASHDISAIHQQVIGAVSQRLKLG